jgi:ABC-type nitrate/sulfonate/bicarbonate transport system ATPase subunit
VLTEADLLLDVRGLGYRRPNGLEVLQDVDLRIGPGEVVAVVGPSGCGKSTLLSLLADLLRPTAGSIGRAAAHDAGERRLTLMFQEETLLPWRSVERNVAFGLERLGVPRAERARRVGRLLAMVGLDEFARARPDELSGGMRRRAQFAACVAPLPRLLLLDEPFSALDEPTRVGLHADVLRVVYELGIGVVLVTHDISEAISLADRVVVLTSRPGRVQQVVPVPLGHDRDVYTVRETSTYQDLYQTLWHLVWNSRPGAASPVTGGRS